MTMPHDHPTHPIPVVSVNPASGEERTLDVNETTPEEVWHLAGRAAEVAADYASRPLAWRARLLRAMADELEANAVPLVEVALRETALTRPRLEGELRRTAFQFRFFADVVVEGAFLHASIDHPTDSPMGPLPDLRRVRVPLGPVAVFGSSNFPFAFSVPGGDTASALAAGCPVVIKAHPAHPETSLATFGALSRAARSFDFDDGLVALVFGFDAGVALVEAPAICAVGFTGSVPAGRALWARANARATPIPFFGELGSANPLVVTRGAARERAGEIGEGIAGSITLGVGQFCTKPGLLFVPQDNAGDELVRSLVNSLEKLSSMTMLSASIASHFRSGVVSIAGVGGNHRLLDTPEPGEDALVSAHLFEVGATLYADPSSRGLRDECFGPVAVVIRYANDDELATALSVTEPALTFSVFCTTGDEDAAWLIEVAQAKAGRVVVNAFPTGVGVSWSMQHGGPWPSTTSPSATSVGAASIDRWMRPVTFQGVPADLLPEALRDDNPLAIPQRVDGVR
ncbi:MAG: aldehyde dehydrogenase (NADP(+)) [Acidimicrobiales bacterium]